jgi:hypothetical protein
VEGADETVEGRRVTPQPHTQQPTGRSGVGWTDPIAEVRNHRAIDDPGLGQAEPCLETGEQGDPNSKHDRDDV